MSNMHKRLNILIFTLVTCLLATPAMAKLYRWVDADGKIHYTDKLPPSQASRARSELNEQGMEVKKVDRAKTAQELAQEKELQRLRKERQKIIDKQQAEDRVLLRTFRSEDDIIMAQDGKLTAIDVMIQIAISNIKQIKSQLVDMQNSAAGQERRGRKPSKKLLDEITNSRQHLKDSYAAIITREKDKENIKQKAQSDLKRFLELKKIRSRQIPVKTQKAIASQLDHVVLCKDTKICTTYWKKAVDYVLQNTTTNIKIQSDSIIITAPPVNDTDISITLSRIKQKNTTGEHIFFDLQCKPSPQGKKFCNSDLVTSIRRGFNRLLLGDGHQSN
ncbi:MAG: DUF4124 domain-containing protein [Gammaproteobacteria bacterium]|nr:DUF4124 domain-containing protein [Gammaproteobacteria bacterium]